MGVTDNSFPEDNLPTCWSDDVRMNALFAPFRLKAANPESWEMKVKFWSDILKQWCRLKNDPVVSASDARIVFQRKGRSPACLEIVVEECLQKGELSPVTKYLQILHNGPEGWVRWGARLAFKPAALAVTTLTSFLPFRQMTDQDGLPKASIDPTERFVMECSVKEQATQLLTEYPSDMERYGTIDELMHNSKYTSSQRETFEILLGYLVSQGLATRKGDIFKLAEPGQRVTSIQDADETMHRLLASERKLVADLEKYTKEADRALEDARVAMKLGNKVAAKNHLRRKHRCLERALVSERALENVRQLIHTMKQAEVNSSVVDTYRMSSEAMKRGMRENDLNEDSVHDTMDELREVLETYNEVEKTLSGNLDDTNMEELENELKELLSSPSAPPGGGTSGRQKGLKPSPVQQKTKKLSERDFIFDGEERMMAELNDLSIEDRSLDSKRGKGEKKKVAVPVGEWDSPGPNEEKSPEKKCNDDKPSKPWYPPKSKFLNNQNNPWQYDEDNNLDKSINELCNSFTEIKMDDRLHPGQKLDLDFSSGPKLYNKDFQVQDHIVSEGIWLYNKDGNENWKTQVNDDFSSSTEYRSEGAGSSNVFQMAPGGERHKENMWPSDEATPEQNLEDLEKRLKNLRGLK